MSNSSSRIAVALAIGAVLATGEPALGAGTFKWVDEKGVTHYGDSIPPEYNDRANSELSKRGLVLKKTDQALTPEQLKAQQEERARQKAADARQKEQQRRDQALLQTFTSEKDIDLKRDRDLQQMDLSIANSQVVLKNAGKRLAESKARADVLTKSGKPVPEGLSQDIEGDDQEKSRLTTLITQKQQEKELIRAKYEDYKRRFLELQGGTAVPAGAPAPTGAAPSQAAAVRR